MILLLLLTIRAAIPQSAGGPWECVDSTGVHGIFFEGDPARPDIFVYDRRTGGVQYGGYFSLDPKYFKGRDRVTLSDNRLAIHFENSPTNRPPFDLQLTFDAAANRWTGSWSDCNPGRVAVLERPRPRNMSTQSPLIGDWHEEHEGEIRSAESTRPSRGMRASGSVLHIHQSIDGQLMVWLSTYDGRIRKLHIERDAAKITLKPNHSQGRESHFEGTVSGDSVTITGQWFYQGLGTTRTIYRRR